MSEVKAQAMGSVGYTGTVKVTVLKNGKPTKKVVKHNAGTYNLMKVLAESLLGKDRSTEMPKFIDAYQGDEWGREAKTSGRLLVRSRIVDKHLIEPGVENGVIKDECSATFIAYIPFSSLRFGGSMPIVGLGLFSKYNYDAQDIGLADVKLSVPITLENSGYAALVEWTLTLQNQLTESETVEESED